MKADEITGMMVMVSPVLWTSDHVGEIGIIELFDEKRDLAWVRFEDQEQGAFGPKTLFILKTSEELMGLAANERAMLWPPLPEDLQNLALMQTTGTADELQKAFELVQDNPELHRLATVRLNEALDRPSPRKINR